MGGIWTSIRRTAVFWAGIVRDAVKETVSDFWSTPLKFAAFVAALVGAVIVWQALGQPFPTYTIAAAGSVLAFLALAIVWKMFSIPARRAKGATAYQTTTEQAGAYPDWPLQNLFFHIRPDVLGHPDKDEANWTKVEKVFLDAASLGRLQVWGRPFDKKGMEGWLSGSNAGVIQPITPEYWRQVSLTHNFYGDRDPTNAAHTSPRLHANVATLFCDLQVNRAQAETIWPGPDPNAKIQFEFDLSVYGVEKIHRQSLSGIGKVSVDDNDRHKVEVFFHKPLEFQYVVSKEGNDEIFLTVERAGPKSAMLRISGPSAAVFPAIVRFKLGSTRFPVAKES